MRIGIYPGSFDPITNGHMDIIERASKLVDTLIVAVLSNPSKSNSLFSIEERKDIIEHCVSHLSNVYVDSFSGLLVDYAKAQGAEVIVRGMRAVTDFEYEMQMAQINRSIYTKVETIFLVTSAEHSFLSSSAVKELARFKGNFFSLVPEYAANKLVEKFA